MDAPKSNYFWWIWKIYNMPTCDKETYDAYIGILEHTSLASISNTITYEQVVNVKIDFFDYIDTSQLSFNKDNDITFFKDDSIYCYSVTFSEFQRYPSIYDGIHYSSLTSLIAVTNKDSYPDEKSDDGFLNYSKPFISLFPLALIIIILKRREI